MDGLVVMDEKTKKVLMFVVTALFALTFISSYASFGNNNVNYNSSGSTTAKNQATYFVAGTANGIVAGYAPGVTVIVKNKTAFGAVGNTLTAMQANGSISNFVTLNNTYQIFTQKINAYSLQQVIFSRVNSTMLAVNSSSYVTLPQVISLNYSKQTVQVHLLQTNFSVQVSPVAAIGSTVHLSVHALITANGTVLNNQITLKQQAS